MGSLSVVASSDNLNRTMALKSEDVCSVNTDGRFVYRVRGNLF